MDAIKMKVTILTVDELKELLQSAATAAVNAYVLSTSSNVTKAESKFLTRQEVADKIGSSLSTINNYMKSGRLPFKKIDRKVFILESDLLKVMNEGGNG